MSSLIFCNCHSLFWRQSDVGRGQLHSPTWFTAPDIQDHACMCLAHTIELPARVLLYMPLDDDLLGDVRCSFNPFTLLLTIHHHLRRE